MSIRPQADLERALETPVRERVQQDADAATYERRAQAVERERTIAENELQSKIELATREQQLVQQEGANAQRRATEEAASALIAAKASSERAKLEAAARADSTRVVGAAHAETEAARLAAYSGVEPSVLTALAFQELAKNLPEIGTLNLTPDVLTQALSRLASTPEPAAPAPAAPASAPSES